MKYDKNQRAIIFDYENLLLGRTHNFSKGLFDEAKTLESRRRMAGTIWNYAITHYLGWTAQEADTYLTAEIVEKLLLHRVYKRINLDPARVLFGNYRFILQYAFPGEIKYDICEEAIEEYDKVCKIGKWKNNTEVHKYPKKFFYGIEGEKRANVLLNYAIAMYMGISLPNPCMISFRKKPRLKSGSRKKNWELLFKSYMMMIRLNISTQR